MMGNRKTIYGLQLPHPSYRHSNVPLSLGYLASFLHQSDLVDEVWMQIAPSQINDYMGDVKLLEHLGRIKPEIIAFSVYPWNIDRTLSIAMKVKANSQGRTRIIFGGPEIHSQNPILSTYTGADYLVTGEGEIPFVEIVRQSLRKDGDISNVKSTAFWDGNQYCWNHDVYPALDLKRLSSPYLTGTIPLERRTAVNLFSYRGCYFKCSYCQWMSSCQVRAFDQDQVLAELDFALTGKKPVIYLSDAAINLSPYFTEICRSFNKARPFNKSVRCFAHLSSLTEEQARIFSETGIKGIEVGLQSIDERVNKGIERRFDKEKFEYGIALLNKYGIHSIIDIIIGLPHADRQSILKTIDYVKNLGLDFSLFHLSVSSGCRLYQEKHIHQLELQPGSPYYVVSTDCLTKDDIHDIYTKYPNNSADQDACLNIGYPGNAQRFFDDDAAFNNLEIPDTSDNTGITDWIIRSDENEPFHIDYHHWLKQSASRLSIWLISDRINPSWLDLLEHIIACLNDNEKHTVVNIYIQTEEFDRKTVYRLEQLNRQIGLCNSFLNNRDYFIAGNCETLRNDKGHICLITSKSALSRSLCQTLPIEALNMVSIHDKQDIDEITAGALPWRGYCVDIRPGKDKGLLIEALSAIKRKVTTSQQVYFCDPVIQRLWLQKIWHICAEPMNRRMLLLKDKGVRIFDYNDYDLALDAIVDFDLANDKIKEDPIDFFARKVRDRLNMGEGKHVYS